MTDLYVALGLSAALLTAALIKKFLTLPAVLLCCALLTVISLCAGWEYGVYLILAYAVLTAADLLAKDKAQKKTADTHDTEKSRAVSQVLANGSFAVIASVLYRLTSDVVFLYIYLTCVAEACADSIASDVGVLSRKRPVSIVTFRTVETGISGGVSLLGMSVSFGMCLLCGAMGVFCVKGGIRGFLVLTILPYIGMITDSILGATVQGRYECAVCGKRTEKKAHCGEKTRFCGGLRFMTNSAVNAVTNLFTGGLTYVIVKYIMKI